MCRPASRSSPACVSRQTIYNDFGSRAGRALARTIARLGISYVAMPPESDDDVAAELAALLAPALRASIDPGA